MLHDTKIWLNLIFFIPFSVQLMSCVSVRNDFIYFKIEVKSANTLSKVDSNKGKFIRKNETTFDSSIIVPI